MPNMLYTKATNNSLKLKYQTKNATAKQARNTALNQKVAGSHCLREANTFSLLANSFRIWPLDGWTSSPFSSAQP